MAEQDRQQVIECVKLRKDMPDYSLNLNKALERAGVEIYVSRCIERVLKSNIMRTRHIKLNFPADTDIWVDSTGLRMIKDILLSYVSPDQYEAMMEALVAREEWAEAVNEVMLILRNMSDESLKRYLAEEVQPEVDEIDDLFIEMAEAELRSRSMPSFLHKKFHMVGDFLKGRIAEGKLLRTITSLPDLGEEDIKIPKIPEDIAYLNAWENFQQEIGRDTPIDRLSKSDLQKYVHLGVKGLVRYKLRRESGKERRSFMYTRSIQIKRLMEAIGRLTPDELMQVFPVDKTYNGDKYQEKDYFYTMKIIEENGRHKEIGDVGEVMIFLWDYMNHHTRALLVVHNSIISDFYKLQSGKGLFESFFGKKVRCQHE